MSASYLVDLYNTTYMGTSLHTPNQGGVGSSGQFCGLSGVQVGSIVDMIHANSFTNLVVTGVDGLISGPLQVAVQTSDTTVSGDFTDPTSGMVAAAPDATNPFPTAFRSGGMIWLNSGGGAGASGGLFGLFASGQAIASGFAVAAGFLRPHRYARALFISGSAAAPANQYVGILNVSFFAQQKTTGSGGGYYTTSGIGGPVVI